MSSFLSIWENMQKSKKDKKDVKSIIHIGYNLYQDFWKNFIQLLQHSESISKLLDVPEHKIATWQEKIETAIQNEKDKNALVTKNAKIIKEELHTAFAQEKLRKIMESPHKDYGLTMFIEDKLHKLFDENMQKFSSPQYGKISNIRDIPEEQRNTIIQSIIQASLNVFYSGTDSNPDFNNNETDSDKSSAPRTHPKDIF